MENEKIKLSQEEIKGVGAFGQLLGIAKIVGAVILVVATINFIASSLLGEVRNCIGSIFDEAPSCSDCDETYKNTKFLNDGSTRECRGEKSMGGDRCKLECKTS